MLRFTGAGVVEAPSAVQIRASATSAGKLGAGAPRPSRDLDAGEILANLRWFAVDRVGPRAAPVTRAILSGTTDIPGWREILAPARAAGVRHVTVHGAPEPGTAGVDEWVVIVDDPERAVAGARAIVPLTHEVLARLPAIVDACVGAGVRSVALTLPFPSASPATERPDLRAAVAALGPAVGALRDAAVPVGVKGIPPCLLHGFASPESLVWRTPNRWYVDADHQRDRALLFLPDVARFAKSDDCRRCVYVARCDGLAEGWLRAGVVERLDPVTSET